MLTSSIGRVHTNLLARAAQATESERLREIEGQELRELRRKHPLTPAHVLRNQQRSRRKGSTDLTTVSQTSPDSSASNGSQIPSTCKHIHFNDRVEQCIAVEAQDDEGGSQVTDDESKNEWLFMGSSRPIPKPHRSTIAKLPATALRPGDETIYDPTQPGLGADVYCGSPNHLSRPSGFYYQEGGGFSSTGSPPEFPTSLRPSDLDDLSFDDAFDNDNLSAHSSTASPRQSSDFELEEETEIIRASVEARSIPAPTFYLGPRHSRTIMDEGDEHGLGIFGLASEAISKIKDLVGILWKNVDHTVRDLRGQTAIQAIELQGHNTVAETSRSADLGVEKDGNDDCNICFDGVGDHCFVPCGHTGICGTCARKSKECPFCKAKVGGMMKLYKT